MINITGYKKIVKADETVSTIDYRAHSVRDDRPVIIKVPKSHPDAARLQNAYHIAHGLKIPGIVEHLQLEKYEDGLALILEDHAALIWRTPFSNNGKQGHDQIDYPAFFSMAIQVADTLGALHRNIIIHKSIKPENIKIEPVNGMIKITGFEMASRTTKESAFPPRSQFSSKDAVYFSPEQTGRMNRPMDFRTDFYSLGVTFYQMLTGERPFDSNDTMEIIHKHIAVQPAPPERVNPQIHKTVSDIILKLLSKSPDDRYHTFHGLKEDLLECQSRYRTNKSFEAFEIGKKDISDSFRIPEKLYGREDEIAALISAFESVNTPEHAKSGMMLISGQPGIGKSALVNEIRKSIVRLRGYFCAGKLDQLIRDIPYRGLIQAFDELIRQLLGESETEVRIWREQALNALGPNGQVVIGVIPVLELIIGPQPPVPELSPAEAQNRFNFVFLNFLSVFAQPGHPLVVFLDDLQWADLATLKLLKTLTTDPEITNFLLIGAYRDNEVHPAHPLMQTLDEINKAGTTFNHIDVGYLDQSDIAQLIMETIPTENIPLEATKSLTEFVYNKTRGNPFFVKQFLTTLYNEKLLTFVPPSSTRDPDSISRTQNGKSQIYSWGWQWDLSQIATRNITDDILELLVDRIEKMTPGTQHVLKLASCIGNRFELQTLAAITEKQPAEIANDLEEAIEKGLIHHVISFDGTSVPAYQFLHDRVQQVAYSLVVADDKPAIHLRNARLLSRNLDEREKEEKIFDLVNHYNLGRTLIIAQEERYNLARLNLNAGRKAKGSAAFEPAFAYSKIGLSLLTRDSWHEDYTLTLALHEEGAETAYLSGNYESMEHLAAMILERAKTTLDCVKIYEVRIQAFIFQQKMLEAIEAGFEILQKLGMKLRFKPGKAAISFELALTKLMLLGKNIEDLERLPEMINPQKLAIMRILMCTTAAGFIVMPEILPVIIFKMVRLSVKYGNSKYSSFAYVGYGFILCGILGNVNSGYRFGRLALSLRDRGDAKELTAKINFGFAARIRHRKEHVRETLVQLLEGYQTGLETGDLFYAGAGIIEYCTIFVFNSPELESAEKEMVKYAAVTNKFRQEMAFNVIEMIRQLILNMREEVKDHTRFQGEAFDEEKMLPVLIRDNVKTFLVGLYLGKCVMAYLFGSYRQSLESALKTELYYDSFEGSVLASIHYLFYSLSLLALYPEASEREKKHAAKTVKSNQKKLKKWAQHAPMNYMQRFVLVEAELAGIAHKADRAAVFYDQAIRLAGENECLYEEALANELAGKCYLGKKDEERGRNYLEEARHCYAKWGALAKVRQLERKYSFLKQTHVEKTEMEETQPVEKIVREDQDFDLMSIMKASQTFSGEIVMESLLKKMMKIVLENAGAQTGLIILEREGLLFIEAKGVVGSEDIGMLQSIPVESNQDYAESVINYAARTRKEVVLHDAVNSQRFPTDHHIVENQPKSILCMPIVLQTKLLGILYLENNLTENAFTTQRINVLRQLSTPIAVSIENAMLYKKIEMRSQELEKEIEVRKMAEEELKAAKNEAENANEAKSDFLANMSHELRTPLNHIIGFTELVVDKNFGDLNEIQEEYLNDSLNSSKHLLSIINDILDLSKVEAGKMDLVLSDISLKTLLKNSQTLISERAAIQGIQISTDIKEIPDTIKADERKLKQILYNLLSNAVKFTPRDGLVHLSACHLRMDNKQHLIRQDGSELALTMTGERGPMTHRDFIEISVSDTGIGIKPEDLDCIFDPFEQVENRTSRRFQGTGLGLSLTQSLVELHGGKIWAESDGEGKGSTFRFVIPV